MSFYGIKPRLAELLHTSRAIFVVFPGGVDVPQLDKWLTHKRARMQNNKTTTTDTGWSYSGLHRNMRLFVVMALIHALLLNTARVNNSTEIL